MLLGLYQCGILLPSHGVDEILRIIDQGCPIVAYQVVTPLRVGIAYAPWEGEHIAVILARQPTGYQSTTPGSTLHENASIAHSRHDAVSSYEVHLLRIRLREMLRQQSALCQHFLSRCLVLLRVEVIESMRQYCHCFIPILQCLAVCVDIHAVGHAAHDEHLWTMLSQLLYKPSDEILSIGGTMACSHDIDHPLLVQVGCTHVEQHQWSIFTFLQPLRVTTVVHGNDLYAISLVILPFRFRPFHRVSKVLQSA